MRHYSSVAAATTLVAPINDAQTTITVAATTGYPVSHPFTLVIDPGMESEEIVTVTNTVGTNLTVVRGEDGTAAMSHGAGAVVRHMVTGRDLREPQQHIAATEDVHGVPGPLLDFINQAVPVGAVLPWAGGGDYLDDITPGDNWLIARGQFVSRAEYPELFAVIGETYGAGDGVTTFRLPSLSSRAPVGPAPLSNYNLGESGGAREAQLTTSELPAHTHTVTINSAGSHSHSASTNSAGAHTHTMSTNAQGPNHYHGLVNSYALISRTNAGNLYFGERSASSRTLSNRVDATLQGSSASRSNFVAVEGRTGDTRSVSGGQHTASVTAASGGAHTHSVSIGSAGAHTHTAGVSIEGQGNSFSIESPYTVLNFIIKAR